MTADTASVLVPGPWEHRFIGANGSRFHVAELGDGPLVLLLHGFPQFWWAWRDQLTGLAEAGLRAVAMDLRGYGASDKPPGGYDARTLADDVAAVVRSLGESQAVIVGHGIGGWVAWSMPSLHPEVTRAVASVGSAHPLVVAASPWRSPAQALAHRYLLSLWRPYLPEHRLTKDPDTVPQLLRRWAAPASSWPPPEVARRYAEAMTVPFAAHSAAEAYRWMLSCPLNVAGVRYLRALRAPVQVPVLGLHGEQDRALLPKVAARSGFRVEAPWDWRLIPDAGHFVHEEAPATVTRALAGWATTLP